MKYLEYKVLTNNGRVIEKNLTKRGYVMISEISARTNNYYTNQTGLLYELAEDQPAEKVAKKGRPVTKKK